MSALKILSLGAGIQSSALALMAAEGVLPLPHCAIFADTQAEPEKVYIWLSVLESCLPFPVHHVTAGNLTADSLRVGVSKKSGRVYSHASIPAFVRGESSIGLLGRRCTLDFKIEPIRRKIRQMLTKVRIDEWKAKHSRAYRAWLESQKAKPKKACEPGAWDEMQSDPLVVMQIGISQDEWLRAKQSRIPYIRHQFPLLEKKIDRTQCEEWLSARGHAAVPRSACRYCPFHSDEEWNRQKTESPAEFALSVQFERDLQSAAAPTIMRGVPFLHESCLPLDRIDFSGRISSGHAQVEMFGTECEGMCGV